MELDQSRHHGALRLHGRERVRDWIDELIAREWLRTTAEEYPRLCITNAGREALAGVAPLALAGFAANVARAEEEPPVEALPAQPAGVALVERLKQWRREKASALKVPPYVILHDSMLNDIAEQRPLTDAELLRVKGIGANRLAQFGAEILSLVGEFAAQSGLEQLVAERDLRLQIELWRQGGAPPNTRRLLAGLHELEHGDLIVAINALKDLGAKEAADTLLGLLRETTNGQLLGTLCEALGQLEVTAATFDIIKLLADERPGVRRATARALGRLRARTALEQLQTLAQHDSSESVKLSATAAVLLIKAAASH
jgi:hypothetical protein